MNSFAFFDQLSDLVSKKSIFEAILAILIFSAGSFIARRARAAIGSLRVLDAQQRLFLSKAAYYGVMTISVAAALSEIGIDIKVIVGAAGVLTVAVGFAAQTSASNLISGFFLMLEKPFVVGDVISVGAGAGTGSGGETRGEVMSIDLLSSRIRTPANLMIRIPNETLVKSQIVNFSYFPIRRLDLNLTVLYHSDLRAVEELLRDVAFTHPLCLDEPQPTFLINGFNDAGISVQLQIFALNANLSVVQNDLYTRIKSALEQKGIGIALPAFAMSSNRQGTGLAAPRPSAGT